uniref:Uncharacterized protein n=1 Tax=Tetranychus urticae TaxID=32264 RepID=T1KFM0_TETUR
MEAIIFLDFHCDRETKQWTQCRRKLVRANLGLELTLFTGVDIRNGSKTNIVLRELRLNGEQKVDNDSSINLAK